MVKFIESSETMRRSPVDAGEDIVQAWWWHQEFMFIAKRKSNTESKVAKSFVV